MPCLEAAVAASPNLSIGGWCWCLLSRCVRALPRSAERCGRVLTAVELTILRYKRGAEAVAPIDPVSAVAGFSRRSCIRRLGRCLGWLLG